MRCALSDLRAQRFAASLAARRHSSCRADKRSASASECGRRVADSGVEACGEVLVHALRFCTLRAQRFAASLGAWRHSRRRADKRSASASKCGRRVADSGVEACGEVLVHALRLCTLRALRFVAPLGARRLSIRRYMRCALSALCAQRSAALLGARRHSRRRSDTRSASASECAGRGALKHCAMWGDGRAAMPDGRSGRAEPLLDFRASIATSREP